MMWSMAQRDGDKPKKSWREIDSQRDKSAPRAEGPSGARGAGGVKSDRQYRAALEALFDKGGIGKVADKMAEKMGAPALPRASSAPAAPPVDEGRLALRKKVAEAIGRDEVTRALDRFLKEYPLPEDFEVLEQALDHRHKIASATRSACSRRCSRASFPSAPACCPPSSAPSKKTATTKTSARAPSACGRGCRSFRSKY